MSTSLLICRIRDAEPYLDHYRQWLDQREGAQLQSLRRPAAHHRYLVTRALVREELARRVHCDPGEVEFTLGAQGKPALKGGDCHFNLSHSHGRVVLAVSDEEEVGVDVEYHRRRNRIDQLARHYFSPREQQQLAALPDEAARRYRFFQLWTLKEAYAKARGSGLWSTLSGTSVDFSQPRQPRLELSGNAACTQRVHFWHFAPDADYSVAVTSIGEGMDHLPPPDVFAVIPGQQRDSLPLVADAAGTTEP